MQIDHPYAGFDRILSDRLAQEMTTLTRYLEEGGFWGLSKVEDMTPLEVVCSLRDAGLRGRGFSGRPVYARWWDCLRRAGKAGLAVRLEHPPAAVAADHALISHHPFGLIEGLAIAGLALGARTAWLDAGEGMEGMARLLGEALAEAQGLGLLAPGSLRLEMGPPPAKHPRLLSHTLETWYHVTLALSLGPAWYAARGVGPHSGTLLLEVVGDVCEPGLVEVPAGALMWQALEEAGGVSSVVGLKALILDQGAAGVLPLESAAVILAPEELLAAGVAPGFGRVAVVGGSACLAAPALAGLGWLLGSGRVTGREETTLADEARRLAAFILAGRGDHADLARLEEIAARLEALASRAAPPLLGSLRHFRGDWLAHLEGACPHCA